MAMFDDLGNLPESKPAAPKQLRGEKTLGDMGAIVEAQRLYNPQMPAVPSPKGPTAAQSEAGATGKTDMSGSWGKPKNG
jgi:hypothetical protein